MKVRNGFVSNSSSSSFAIPMSFLTDEQTEILLSIDDSKETKKQLAELSGDDRFVNKVANYPRNEEYHKIYRDMIEAGEWMDSGWTVGIELEGDLLTGGTMMYNGSITIFMEEIGIDISALELNEPGFTTMPNHPEALKLFAKRRENAIKWYKNLADDSAEKIYLLDGPIEDNPYTLDNSEFKHWHDNKYRYESKDGIDYLKEVEK